MKPKQAKLPKALHPYNTSFYSAWPTWVKIIITKWWFTAATYYFVGFGMPHIKQSAIDVIFNMGLVIGALSALILYPLINYITKIKNNANDYKAIKSQSPLRIIYLVGYNWLVVAMIAYSYQIINMIINGLMHYESGTIRFGVEPILFGVFYVMLDVLLIKAIDKIAKVTRPKGSK